MHERPNYDIVVTELIFERTFPNHILTTMIYGSLTQRMMHIFVQAVFKQCNKHSFCCGYAPLYISFMISMDLQSFGYMYLIMCIKICKNDNPRYCPIYHVQHAVNPLDMPLWVSVATGFQSMYSNPQWIATTSLLSFHYCHGESVNRPIALLQCLVQLLAQSVRKNWHRDVTTAYKEWITACNIVHHLTMDYQLRC